MLRTLPSIRAIGVALLLVIAAPALAAAQGGRDSTADARIRAVIATYFRGHATGSGAEMRPAFLPTAHIEGVREGKFTTWTVDEYVGRFTGRPAADEASRKRTIDQVDVVGSAAMAKATLVHGATVFTDYFVLLEVDGAWKIANKVYHAERR